MRRLSLALALLLCGSAFGQTFDLDKNRLPLMSIDGLWRFHPGDDMRWADPNFDDSSWKLLRSDALGDRGLEHLPPPLPNIWYRFQISIPAKDLPAALMLPPILPDYEVFVNGRKVRSARTKSWPSRFVWGWAAEVIPLETSESGLMPRTFIIAIRAASGGGAYAKGGLAGSRKLIDERVSAAHSNAVAESEDETVDAVVSGLVGALIFGLFCMRTKDREYLWFALTLLGVAGYNSMNILAYSFAWMSISIADFLAGLFICISDASALLFFRIILGRPRTRIWWVCFIAAIANGTVVALVQGVPPRSQPVASALAVIFELPAYCWILTMLIYRAYVRDRDAQILLVPTLVNFGWATLRTIVISMANAEWLPRRTFDRVLQLGVEVGPWRMGLMPLLDVMFVASLLAFLIRRFALSRQREERLVADVEAARQVQQILLPEENPSVSGFQIESVYLPAETVSGDFFQHIPDGQDGLLIVAGDVAGKGLQAAMLVSVLVGAIRTEAGHTSDPGRILAVLNERLQGRGKNSFATCLVAHISSAGQMQIANAGHIPPYLNGAPLDLPGSLPLGMATDSEYEVHEFRLNPGDSLRFVSDGVLEAQDAAGNLLGFERTRELSREKAQQIAKAAQEFGQKDDITVVAVDFLGVAHAAA